MTIRYIKQNSREDTCKNCPELDVNYNSDESYCNLADSEEVRLKRGQHRPEWCPMKEQEPLEPYACEGDMMCGNGCEIVGYIRESDGKIERLLNYCPYCGRPVKWD